jgi:hypothetical protein
MESAREGKWSNLCIVGDNPSIVRCLSVRRALVASAVDPRTIRGPDRVFYVESRSGFQAREKWRMRGDDGETEAARRDGLVHR